VKLGTALTLTLAVMALMAAYISWMAVSIGDDLLQMTLMLQQMTETCIPGRIK
jgi:hypothetical protein